MVFWTALFTITGVFFGSCHVTYGQSFIVQPQNKLNKLRGKTVTFYCKATGLVNPTYYWLKDGINTTRGISGLNTKAYITITSVSFGDAGLYSCCASDSTKSITSNQARLTVAGDPEIVQPPSAISPHIGQAAVFQCLVYSNPKATISWYYAFNLLTNGGRISIFDNGTLMISNVMKSDAGQYKLEAENSLGSTLAFADLTVLDPPLVPSFTTTPQNKTGKEGNDVTFYCAASGTPRPTIKWIRIDGVIPSDRRSQPQPGAMRLSNLVPSDDGVYACVASNTQGERREIFYLRIEGYPRFTISPSNKEVKENKSIIFNCAATSVPQPTLKWLLPNGTIITSLSTPSGNVRVLSNNTLVIDRVSEYHGGIYICEASNSIGFRQEEATLSVLTPPRYSSLLQNMTKTRGQELTITCPARGNPAPEFQWIFGGNIIKREKTLRMASLKVADQGYYICRVNNSIGVTSSTFYLRVHTLPIITTTPTNKTVGNGVTAVFHCQSQGDPAPSVTWMKSGVLIQSNGRYSVLPNGTLSVAMVTVSDQGWFSCLAQNAAGRDEKKAFLVVTGLPIFTESPSNKTKNVSEQVILQCRAVAQDTPVITWYKVASDGSRQKVTSAVTLASGNLSFDSVKIEDRSMYACQACNAAGCRTTPKVMLNVLYGPFFPVPPSPVGVLEDEDAVLRCEPDSSPKAVITWRRPNGEKMEGTGYEQIIQNVRPADTGDYTCKASNPYGETGQEKIKLEIQTKPVIVNLVKQDSTKTIITCKVGGKPTPDIHWCLNKTLLPQYSKYRDYHVTRDNKLEVPIGSLENNTFLCKARNPRGFVVNAAKVPERPSSVSISEVTSHSLRVTWVRPSSPEFLITRYLLEVWSAKAPTWQSLNDTIERQSYDVSELSAFTVYIFRVKAANGLGTSDLWRTSQNVTTLSYKPSVPRNLSLSVQSAEAIKITWSVPQTLNGPLSDLQYHVIYEPKSPNTTNEYNMVHNGTGVTQGYNLEDLEPDVRYLVRVSAWRRQSDGTKLESSQVTVPGRTFQLEPTTPPIGLVVEASGPNRIIVKWKKPPYSVGGYNIWYRQNKPGMTHTKVKISDGSATTYLIKNLEENTEYQVRAQMYSNGGEGPFSKYYEVRTATDTFFATQNQDDERGASWEIAVGGLVSGLLLLLIVIGIVCFLKRRSRQSNQTFRVSTRRGGAQSDVAASSAESDGTVEGHYNIAFNHELDHNLDLDMFSDDGNVIPISTSFHNERAIQYLASSQPEITQEVPRGDSSEPTYANLPRISLSDAERVNNDFPYQDVNVSNKMNDEGRDSKQKDSIDTPERAPDNDGQNNPVGIPVYSQVDMSKKKNRRSSKESELDQYPTPETTYDKGFDDEGISEVPYPEEDLPRLERTWTNVSEFNFPPPPDCPPPDDNKVPNSDDASMEPRNVIPPISYEEPYEDVDVLSPSNKEPKAMRHKGPRKRQMVAAWAEDEEEPIGNLWEAVDKELDRRLGTT